MLRAIFKNSIILTVGITIGRLSGYARELVVSYKYKVSADADIILLLLTLPDLINNFLSVGIVSSLMIPLLSREQDDTLVLTAFIKKAVIISIAFYLVSTVILATIYDSTPYILLLISFVSVFPNVLTSIVSAYLQYRKRFVVQSFSTLIFNCSFIVFLIGATNKLVLAAGVVISAVCRFMILFVDFLKTGVRYSDQRTDKYSLKYGKIVTVILSNGIMYINPLIDKMFASRLTAGSVATLSYAEKIYLLPVSVFLTTYSVALLPDLAELIAKKEVKQILILLKKSIFAIAIVSLIVGICMFFCGFYLIKMLYGFTGLSDGNLRDIHSVFNGYLGALVIAGVNSILVTVIFAFHQHRIAMYYALSSVLLKIGFDVIIVWNNMNVYWLAASTSVVYCATSLVLMVLILKEHNKWIIRL